MLNSRGLGEQVQRKKEAYQSNPQALQQQYQQSQQLVDLLALQQLKSEKEAAARNMQMQMQQNPATIAQQREQEVLGMIKQEQGRKLGDVAQRTAGTLGQINKRAQQNVQRTAKQGLPSIGGPQRPPANAPQKPAMMAGGGIVAFQEGSKGPIEGQNVVLSEEQAAQSYGDEFLTYIKDNPAEIASMGLMFVPGLGLISAGGRAAVGISKVLPKLKEIAKKALRKKDDGPDFEVTPKGTAVPKDRSQIQSTSSSKEMVPYKGDPTRPVDAGKQLTDPRRQQVGPYRGIADSGISKLLTGFTGLGQFLNSFPKEQEELKNLYPPDPNSFAPKNELQKNPPAPEMPDYFAGIDDVKPVKPEFGTLAQDSVRERAGILGLAGANEGDPTPEQARDAEQERVIKALGRDEKLGVKDTQLERMRALQGQQNDPEKLRREQIQRGLIGMTGRSANTMFGGYAAGKFNERQKQEAAARKNLVDQFGIENEKIQLDFDITNAGIGSGMKAFEINQADRRAIASDMTKATNTDIELGKAYAQQVFDADTANLTTKLTAASAAAERALEELKGRRDAGPKLIAEYNILTKTKFDAYKELQQNSALMSAFRSGDPAQVEQALLQTEVASSQLAELTQVHALEELIENELRALGVPIPTDSRLSSGNAELDKIMQIYGSM